jgi:hypothetical protein
MNNRIALLSAAAFVAAACMTSLSGGALASGRTIAGTWAPDPNECTPANGMVVIGPLDIVGDEFRCDFTSVSRAGDVVTWRGTCGFPTPFKPATVIARLTGETLRININGGENDPYWRCR